MGLWVKDISLTITETGVSVKIGTRTLALPFNRADAPDDKGSEGGLGKVLWAVSICMSGYIF